MNALRARILQRLTEYVDAVLAGRTVPWQQLGTGPVRELEERLGRYTGMRHALLAPSATTGLLMVGLAIGMRRGAHFITTPYTWGGALVWLYLGCRVSFADLDPETLTLDPESVARCIRPQTRAVLSVDTDGVPSDDGALRELADRHGLVYVADCARSLGARRAGRPAGRRAHVMVLSFSHGKTLDLGEGGAVLTDDEGLYERLLLYGQHPMRQKKELGLDAGHEVALNGRIHPLAALLGAELFDRALRRARLRRRVGRRLVEDINDTGLAAAPDWTARGIVPTYYRLTFTWRGRPQPEALRTRLGTRGWRLGVEPLAAMPVYRDPGFIRRFGRRVEAAVCPAAEQELARRWAAIVLQPPSPRSIKHRKADPRSGS